MQKQTIKSVKEEQKNEKNHLIFLIGHHPVGIFLCHRKKR
jgi:hypothetical protein